MKPSTQGLLGALALAGTVFMAGCLPSRPPSVEKLAEQVHRDMQAIGEAALSYRNEHGAMPEGDFWKVRSALVLGGHIANYPTPPAAVFASEPMDYRIDNQYDAMDAGPAADAAVVVWGLRDAVCAAYNAQYAGVPSPPPIYDWEAMGKRYPGEAIGPHLRTYAIKWSSATVDDCEIEWVVEYR